MSKKLIFVGIDVGSTTVKIVILDEAREILYKQYRRHYSDIKNAVLQMLEEVKDILENSNCKICLTGSAGMGIAEALKIQFVQEVIASSKAVETFIPQTDVAIELGGEDAKITYFGESLEQRMNGTCAGGTGSFIDQMAILLKTDASGLNQLAKKHTTVYPIASRCGVFAKTDIQPLLNEGAKQEDIAASILQAVVNQTISGLACGKPIKGKVAFLGGPLYFLDGLRDRFIETLMLTEEEIVFPEDSQYFVAMGAALTAEKSETIQGDAFYSRLPQIYNMPFVESTKLDPLFKTAKEYEAFKERHSQHKVKRTDMHTYKGKAYLGIDAGSTTTKVVLIDQEGGLLYEYYGSNQGNPLKTVQTALKQMYEMVSDQIDIVYGTVTGYGENLIKTALKLDLGEVETVAHYTAADYFLPGVSFIMDIGGQDMKSLKIRNQAIDSIMLNEACSSGCGSFIETFAKSLNMEVADFAALGVKSRVPVDLGTRCTVFMNSRVKQAQKEGAEVADISAGIALSVIKNALYKVIRIKDVHEMGDKIVVQGGTFYNDTVLRSFEMVSGKEVIRPEISGLMGAFGAALISRARYKEGYETEMLKKEALNQFSYENSLKRCGGCGNKCLMTITHFSDSRDFISGNRCENGLYLEQGLKKKTVIEDSDNLYSYKYKRLFGYKPLDDGEAIRGKIGIPRVLNMYEDYPFWFRFFTELKYKVVLSARSSKQVYEKGMESIPSESVCYPAKLVHGHIEDLIQKGVDKIWYPCIPYNYIEDENAGNHYHCPIVSSYPETINANVETLETKQIQFYKPFLPIFDRKGMFKRLVEEMTAFNISAKEIKRALDKAYEEYEGFKKDVREKGDSILKKVKAGEKQGIVLAGRPYHLDPEINHGIPEMIESFGLAILTEDVVAYKEKIERPIRVVDQWTYHARLYAAAAHVAKNPALEYIQLNSFGCGLDAVTTDQVKEILENNGKLFTVVKIDEINNLGAVRIRIRSLIAAMANRVVEEKPYVPITEKRNEFTAAMRQEYTILAPQMSPMHFQFFEPVFHQNGYNIKVLPAVDKKAIDTGLKYVNNDACYPAIIVAGQMMQALESGDYDLNKTALLISQTGGGCRATNYIAFIRKALEDAGMDQIPVISLNAVGLEKNSGFKITKNMVVGMAIGVLYGDLLLRMVHKVRPYEKVKGSTDALYDKWVQKCREHLENGGKLSEYKKNVRQMVKEFDTLEIDDQMIKPKVGVVGEILVKYHPTANNNIIEVLEHEGAEVVIPDLMDFVLYCAHGGTVNYELLAGKWMSKFVGERTVDLIEYFRKPMKKALEESKRFEPPVSIYTLAEKAKRHLSLGNQMGEGWFLTAEMIELIESGVENIACIQPFACLPNHVTGKGMIKELRKAYPKANIAPIDYDPGASEVNQINRLKLMMATAQKHMEKEELRVERKRIVLGQGQNTEKMSIK